MPFCNKAHTECPVAINLRHLSDGTLPADNIVDGTKLDDLTISKIIEIVAETIESGICLGPALASQEELDYAFTHWGPLISAEMEGTTFCGISNDDKLLARIDEVYGINLNAVSLEL